MTTMTLIRTSEVAKSLGIVARDIERGLWGVTVHRMWNGERAITEDDATRLRDRLAEQREANRRRKREEAEQKAREADMFESDRERQYWTAFAAVIEDNAPWAHREAPGVALAVINAEEPENELQRVISRFGKPSEHAIMFVMGRAKESSITHKPKGAPKWLR